MWCISYHDDEDGDDDDDKDDDRGDAYYLVMAIISSIKVKNDSVWSSSRSSYRTKTQEKALRPAGAKQNTPPFAEITSRVVAQLTSNTTKSKDGLTSFGRAQIDDPNERCFSPPPGTHRKAGHSKDAHAFYTCCLA